MKFQPIIIGWHKLGGLGKNHVFVQTSPRGPSRSHGRMDAMAVHSMQVLLDTDIFALSCYWIYQIRFVVCKEYDPIPIVTCCKRPKFQKRISDSQNSTYGVVKYTSGSFRTDLPEKGLTIRCVSENEYRYRNLQPSYSRQVGSILAESLNPRSLGSSKLRTVSAQSRAMCYVGWFKGSGERRD